jgi:hypothetical protein
MHRRPLAVRLASLALTGCALVPAVTACSDDAPGAQAPSGADSDAPATGVPSVPTRVDLGRVVGRLDPAARRRLVERVTPVVDSWIDGAFGGDYPRDDFAAAFGAFTEGAASRAAEQSRLMSNAAVGGRLDDVGLLRRRVLLDVLAVEGAAAAVTARVDLVLRLSGDVARRDRVRGSLLLTYERSGGTSGWRVFGYDITRGDA